MGGSPLPDRPPPPSMASRAFPSVLASILLIAPVVAADYGPGTAVDKKDYDFFPKPSMRTTALCYLDIDGTGTIGMHEPLFLKYKAAACGSAAGKDIRLNMEDGTPGPFRVDLDDPAFGKTLTPVPAHAVRYVDVDGDGKLKKKDAVILDLANVGGSVVDPGDFRLMDSLGGAAFTFVKAGDADLTFPLNEMKGAAGDDVGADAIADAQVHEAGVLYEAGKAFYINADSSAGDTAIEEGDVRIGKVPTPWVLPDFGAPALEIIDQTSVDVDGLHIITVIVRNIDDKTGAGLLQTSVGGRVVDARGTPTLAPGEQVELVIALPLSGEVSVAVSDEDGFQVFGSTEPVGEESPGLGALALLAVVGAAVVLRRR